MEEIDKYLPEKEHLRILDVGCGAGFFSILLAKRGHQVTGIDLTPDMILHARENTLMQECEDIKRQLSISNYARPAWDLETLSNSGVQQFQIDMGVSQRVYMEKNAFYNPTPLFAVCGKKGDL